MLHPFVSTRALRASSLGAMTFSLAAHTGLIAIALAPRITSTSHDHGVMDRGYFTERVHFIEAALAARARHREKSKTRGKTAGETSRALSSFRFSEVGPLAL